MFIEHPKSLSYIPKRIISLVPSQTELLFHLGLHEEVVGITKFCIHPTEWHSKKAKIGGTKKVNIPIIKSLQPDLIIANKEENEKEQIEALAQHFPVWVTNVNTLQDALKMISDIGNLTTTIPKANQIANQIKANFESLHPSSKSLNTAYLIWQKPYMTVGGDTFINDMLQKCGFTNLFANEKRYPEITIEQLLNANCQLLLLSSEPYPFKQKHIHFFEQYLPNTKIKIVDGEMFSWYGSRIINAPQYFKGLIQGV
jgi:ABC-type Fe3+-hydroxamate transport system substrate-binding protein